MQRATSFALIAIAAVTATGLLAAFQFGGPAPALTAGSRIDAIGDSITRGIPVDFELDSSNRFRHSDTTYQGWPGLLDRLISTSTAGAVKVRNLGVPGVKVSNLVSLHPRRFFGRQLGTSAALLMIGSNDTHPDVRTPSGLGCKGSECDGTYAGYLQRLIGNLKSSGVKTIYVAEIPPIWGEQSGQVFADPLAETAIRNQLVQEYNRVIREQIVALPGVLLGPDFFSCFLTAEHDRFSLFEDWLHPNKLGHVVMAAIWRDKLFRPDSPGSTCTDTVYVVGALDARRFGHQQTLISTGGRYYTDQGHLVLEVPKEFESGVWIIQPNANRANDEADYLEFDVGPSPASVYIAYDPAGEPPASGTHDFEPVTLSSPLRVSQAGVRELALLRAVGVTGRVRIGGTASTRLTEGQQAYTTVVVP